MSLEHDILSILRTTEWKTTLTIQKELRAAPYKRRFLLATMYVRLDTLQQQGLVKARLRPLEWEAPEVIKARGGLRAMEYCLTPGGLRAKNERTDSRATWSADPALA